MNNYANTSTLSPDFSLNTSKESIKDILQKFHATITFTKKDGSTRVMKCTLREGTVRPYEKKTDRTRDPHEDILPVWDIEADAWRSVTISQIQTIELSH